MEVIRLPSGFSLLVIILLFHNVSLQNNDEDDLENVENEEDDNVENEEDENVENEEDGNVENEEDGNVENEENDNVNNEEDDNVENEEEHNIENEEDDNVENEEDDNVENEEDVNVENEEDDNVENEEDVNVENEEDDNVENEEDVNVENEEDDNVNNEEDDNVEKEEENRTEEEISNSIEKGEVLARKPATFHWSSGTVPYTIKTRDYDTIIATRIRAAMHTIQSSSCVVFKDMTRSKPQSRNVSSPWLSIENPEGVRECSHSTLREEGTIATKAILIVGYDCMQQRDILHALLHALGLRDEVTHPQRDLYIRVVWPNIQPRYRSLFYMKKGETPQKMVEYDSMSIMHFHDRAYTINGGATILPQVPGLLIAPSDTLSQLDVMKLRLAFGHECNKRKVANLLRTCFRYVNTANDQ